MSDGEPADGPGESDAEASGGGGDDLVTVDSAELWPEDAMDVEEAVVSNWFVREGSTVEAGETIGEIQIEKVSVDVTASVAGEVVELSVAESAEFARGDPLARIRPA